jgi:hypothetical protein
MAIVFYLTRTVLGYKLNSYGELDRAGVTHLQGDSFQFGGTILPIGTPFSFIRDDPHEFRELPELPCYTIEALGGSWAVSTKQMYSSYKSDA